jgi:hypothetical protein
VDKGHNFYHRLHEPQPLYDCEHDKENVKTTIYTLAPSSADMENDLVVAFDKPGNAEGASLWHLDDFEHGWTESESNFYSMIFWEACYASCVPHPIEKSLQEAFFIL